MAGAEDLERRLGIGVDRAIGRHADQPPPTSRWWPFFGLVQSANQLAIAGVAAWLVVWFVVRPDLPDVTLPILGPLPAPVVLLGVALLVGYLLARLLSLHAGWLGRRWGMRLSDAIRREVGAAVAETAFAGVDRLEAARAAIAATREQAERDRRPANEARPGRIRRALDAAMH